MKRPFIRITAVVLMVAAVLMIACSCAAGDRTIAKQAPDSDTQYTITGELSVTQASGKILVELTTDIMDGCTGRVCVDKFDGTSLFSKKATVSGGKLTYSVDVDGSWEGPVCVSVVFSPDDNKNSEIRAAYGKKFQNIVGEDQFLVWNTRKNFLVFQSGLLELD